MRLLIEDYWRSAHLDAGYDLLYTPHVANVDGDRLGKQIRTAQLEKIPVFAVVGNREVEQQTLSVRSRQSGDLGVLTLEELQEKMQVTITDKSLF